jgi:D-arginine dehydrogenase
MMPTKILIIGAGIAGAGIAARLGSEHSVSILDMEDSAGFHSTGRSAALFTENYGSRLIRELTRESRSFFEDPPDGFADRELLSSRGILYLAQEGQLGRLREFASSGQGVREISVADAKALVPNLRDETFVGAAIEPDAADIDVNLLHQGYLRAAVKKGAAIILRQRVQDIRRDNGRWLVKTQNNEIEADIVVNAAGAWADEIGKMAGIAPIGMRPLKRTAAIVKFDRPIDRNMPFLNDMEENWYCRPEGEFLFLSPEDEIPSEPCDAWADDMDVAAVVEKIISVLHVEPVSVESSWAGLRTFSPDGDFVIGFEPGATGFFWLAGLGGYGIQTAPAYSELAAALLQGRDLPMSLQQRSVKATDLAPDRFRFLA